TMDDVNVNAPIDQAPTMALPTHTDEQILPHIRWGVINRAHIDYAKRIWEEFTQSIHTFIENKKNLARHTHRKKKATLILIPSIRFTKLIIYYLQRKHKFHPRPDSPFHLPNEVPILGYLKFSAKGTKREVCGMPIPDNLITADIQGEPYYKEYLEKVAKHQRYLAGEKGSDPDSPIPKLAKATKKSKPSTPKADLRPPVTKPASSQQPEPKPAPAKSQGKKRKLVTETSDKPSPARRSKPVLVTKRRKPTSSLRSVDESVDEGIPDKEPRLDDEEADVQRALEESLKSVYDAPRVTDEQIALDLLTLQTPKKKSPADQFIFQRCTSTPTKSSGHDESSSLYDELGLTDSEVESDEDVPWIDAGVQDEGQAGPNPGEQDEGQAGQNPGDAATTVSTQVHPEQMDEGFTTTAYPSVQENLKLTVEEQVILEEPASSIGTLSSLQHLAKDLSFGDLFFNDKPSEADNKKTTAKTKAESMVSVTIQQDASSIPPMTTPIINLTLRPDSPNVHRPLQATTTETTTTTTTHPPPPQPQQSTTYSMLMKRIGELEQIMANLIQDNKHLEERDLLEVDMKEILHQRMWDTNSYKTHEDYMMSYEALEKYINRDHTNELLKDLAEARKNKKKSRDSPKTPPRSPPHQPPPHPPPAGPSGTSRSLGASVLSQVLSPPPPPPSINQKDLHIDDDMAPDAQVHSFDDEYIENAHIPKVNLRQDWWKPLEEDKLATPEPAWSIPSSVLPTGDMAIFMDWFCKRQGITKLKPQDLEGPAFELVKVFHPNGSRHALSISKMKAAYYPDVGLEQMVLDQMWIEEEWNYDITTMYGISYWWFQRQRFYIDRHTSEGDRRAVRTHMRILSVVRIEVFSMYGYDYMKKTVLRRADLNEHIIAERDFKYLYPSDFEDLYLLNLQVIDSLRAVTFRDKYGVQMIMRFNEIHKFSDGTLH
nr:hypothetical protein [Tanacetum cinerariifolium]